MMWKSDIFHFWVVLGLGFLVGLAFVILFIGLLSRIRPYTSISIWLLGIALLLTWNFKFAESFLQSYNDRLSGSLFFAIRCVPTFTFLILLRQVAILQKKDLKRFTVVLNGLLILSFSLAFYKVSSSIWFEDFSSQWIERLFWVLVGVYSVIQTVWLYLGIKFTFYFTAFLGSFILPFLGFVIGVVLESQFAFTYVQRNSCLGIAILIQAVLVLFLLLEVVIPINDDSEIADTQKTKSDDNRLSPRELEILTAYANGFTYNEISKSFLVSPNTVKTHLRSCYKKLKINTKLEAAEYIKKLKNRI